MGGSRDNFVADGRGADGLHAELAAHEAARRIVDARDDALNLEHSLRDQGGHDIAVVAVGDGDETVGGRCAGSLEHVVVDAGPYDDMSLEAWSETFECGGVFV